MAETVFKQSLKLEDRALLCVDGVTGLREFSETEVVFESGGSLLIVSGEQLCVTRLTLENGESAVTGRIDALLYAQDTPKKGFLSRLFG